MTDKKRKRCVRKLLRFRTCRARVQTQHTQGNKFLKKFQVRTNKPKPSTIDETKNCSITVAVKRIYIGEVYNTVTELSENEDSRTLSNHQKRRRKEFKSCMSIRDLLLDAYNQCEGMQPNTSCRSCGNKAVSRCRDRGQNHYYCANCIRTIHRDRNYSPCPELFEVCVSLKLVITTVYQSV